MLKSGGTLAVFWQMSSVMYHGSDIFTKLNELKRKYLPNESLGYQECEIQKLIDIRIEQIQSCGYFMNPEIYQYRWIDTYDADRYVALINSYSSTQLLTEADRKSYLDDIKILINDNGGKVNMPQHVILYLVHK